MMLREGGFTGLIPVDEVDPSELHRLKGFKCGSVGLDSYLQNEAQDLHRDHLNRTSVLFHEDYPGLVGYITLTNDSIPLTPFEVGELGLNYSCQLASFPAVKLCRLAVHEDLQRCGVGERIIDLTIGGLLSTHGLSSSRFLITDAINVTKVIGFYKRHGFVESYWAAERTKRGGAQTAATIKMLRDMYA